MIRAAIWTIGVALVAAAAGFGGGGGGDGVPSQPVGHGGLRFTITKVERATTPRSAYRQAHRECRRSELRSTAKADGVAPSAGAVADVVALGYRDDLRWFARRGCADGFAGRYRPIDGW